MLRSLCLLASFLLCVLPPLRAQYGMSRATLAQVPVEELPLQHNAALRAREEANRKPNRPQQFAVSLPVQFSPTTAGRWLERKGQAVWQLRVRSPGAESLNLGFTDYRLPPGAELYLATESVRYGPFTAADNADHAQFWSPLLAGDELLVELVMPGRATEGAGLTLSTVNHDFVGIIQQVSGNCNIDVACGVADGYPLIEDYRDVIRSVAAYTLNGREQCTGFLVNNTNQDGRPLFLTAEHCNITADNAPSLVAYWNFENSNCREPGSAASGKEGDGSLKVFNSGARLLATYPATDMTLLELEEPVNPAANAFYAGWSAEGPPPADGVAIVHHPELDEKRISFSFQPTVGSDPLGGTLSGADFNYIKVVSWDEGTTQGGSSGAPLFDHNGRVRGQLLGGLANCGNQQFDVFGYLNRSWTGGGTPATRLRDHLDPCGSGRRTSDGLEQAVLARQISATRSCLTRCVGEPATFTVRAGTDYPTGSEITIIAPEELDIMAPPTVYRNRPFTVRYVGGTEVAPGSYPIQVIVMAGALSDTTVLSLTLTVEMPPAPRPLAPAAGQPGVDPFATLSWEVQPSAVSYELQVAASADFSSRILDVRELTGTDYVLSEALDGSTTYYWRVRARSRCGAGDWSAPRSFTTLALQCLAASAAGLPVVIPGRDSVRVIAELTVAEALDISSIALRFGVDHSFTGDLYAELVSPTGKTIRLFRPLSNGLCTGTNIYVDFSDDGAITAEDFGSSCPGLPPGTYQSVRPLDPLNALIGSSAQGTWQLVVTDRAPEDGGNITVFELRICGKGVDGRDLGVGVTSAGITACANEGGSARLQLGPNYTDELSLRVEAGEQPLDNYTFAFDPVSGLLDVTFTAWTLVGPGTRPLTYTVLAADGTERRAVQTLTVIPGPTVAEPLSIELEATQTTFRWQATTADTYTLQLAEANDFTTPFYSATTAETTFSVPRDSLPPTFYYRLITTTACGSLEGPGREVILEKLNSLPDFGAGRSIAVFPNPTHGQLTLSRQGNWSGELLHGTLYSPTGQALRQWPQLRSTQETLQLGNLPAGIYSLRLRGAGGAQTTRIVLH